MLIPDLPYRRGREGFSDDFLRKFRFPYSCPPIDRRKSRRRRMRSPPNWYLNFRNGSLVAINRHVSGSERNSIGVVVAVLVRAVLDHIILVRGLPGYVPVTPFWVLRFRMLPKSAQVARRTWSKLRKGNPSIYWFFENPDRSAEKYF